MEIEYYKGILIVRINILNKKILNKLNYVINIIKKYQFKYMLFDFNNIKSNSLSFFILNASELIEKWGGYLYLYNISKKDIILSNIDNIIFQEGYKLNKVRGE